MNEEEFYGGWEKKQKNKNKKKNLDKQTKFLNHEAAQKHNFLNVRRTIARKKWIRKLKKPLGNMLFYKLT